MIARLVSVAPDGYAAGSRSSYQGTPPLSSQTGSSRRNGKSLANQRSGPIEKEVAPDVFELDGLGLALMDSLREGILVLSREFRLLYINPKGRELCQSLLDRDTNATGLPLVISEVCHRLVKRSIVRDSLVMEYQINNGQALRIQASWLSGVTGAGFNRSLGSAPHILLQIKNCTEVLQEELRIEQRKYDLTDREAEIWMLLRQEYTYQEIAQLLQISLNTVKTHVKNVYAKKRSWQGREKFWYLD